MYINTLRPLSESPAEDHFPSVENKTISYPKELSPRLKQCNQGVFNK